MTALTSFPTETMSLLYLRVKVLDEDHPSREPASVQHLRRRLHTFRWVANGEVRRRCRTRQAEAGARHFGKCGGTCEGLKRKKVVQRLRVKTKKSASSRSQIITFTTKYRRLRREARAQRIACAAFATSFSRGGGAAPRGAIGDRNVAVTGVNLVIHSFSIVRASRKKNSAAM